MYLTLPGSDIILHAVGLNAAGEYVFQGTIEDLSSFGSGNPIPITTYLGYSVGDRGPGGGWIFYDKVQHGGVFGDDGQMGKSWRYLEIAPSDFSTAWTEANDSNKINSDHKIENNKVKLKSDSSVVLFEYDWYWGPAETPPETYSTLPDAEQGWLNTDKLDALSSATPNIKQVKGRKAPAPAESTTNTRRDLSKTLRSTTINSYSDWFVPSKTELQTVLSYLIVGETTREDRNFANTVYWSSSESETIYALAIDFTPEASETEITQDRSEVSRVRPARAF